MRLKLTLLQCGCLAAGAFPVAMAFVDQINTAKPPTTNNINNHKMKFAGFMAMGDVTEIPYGEESRKYRRTVYSHDDWVKHRSPDRFWKNLRTTTNSGIYKVLDVVNDNCLGR
jgi:ion channel-forming bestrophin family protein